MLVLEVVTATIAFLIAGVSGQEPRTLDRSQISVGEKREIDKVIPSSPLLASFERLQVQSSTQVPHKMRQNENLTWHMPQESGDLSDEILLTRQGSLYNENTGRSERSKRKVIFGGGSVGHAGRRGGAAVGGDPWGRRRDHHGPGGNPYDAWPQYKQSAPFVDGRVAGPSVRHTTTLRPDYVLITTTSPSKVAHPTQTKVGNEPGNSSRSKAILSSGQSSRKLTRNVKWDIAKYALQHGTDQAANRYEKILGKRLSHKKIEKFIKKYQRREKRSRGRRQ